MNATSAPAKDDARHLVARRINDSPKPWAVIQTNGRFGDEIVAGFCTESDARLFAVAPALFNALEPFADISGEGDEDFPDETPVTVIFGRTTHHALRLGDLRRAVRAIVLAEGA